MNGKRAKAARRQARASAARAKPERRSPVFGRITLKSGLVVLAVAALVAGSFVLPGAFHRSTPSAGAPRAMAAGARQGEGLPIGSAVPAFAERDVLTGEPISSRSVYGRKTLLFFSEGVMCQACFEQIQGLQRLGTALKERGIRLVSITPDSRGELVQAARLYGITTPLISDADRDMSQAFNTLGKGMHGDTPGHAFAVVDHGKVLWYRDYWLPPDRTMYVDPRTLLAEIPRGRASHSGGRS